MSLQSRPGAALPLFCGLLIGLVCGCGVIKEKPKIVEPVARLRPSDVVANLILAYKQRNIVHYAELLADDFQFKFDEASRPAGVPEYWTRLQDSTGTGNLFAAPAVRDIRISLTYDKADKPDNQLDHPGWRKILVTDTFLEVDRDPPNGVGEVTTFRVDGDEQQYYFRKGRNPADTLASSTSAHEWYLVEWHDLAHPAAPTDVANR